MIDLSILLSGVIIVVTVLGLMMIAWAAKHCKHAFCELVEARPEEEPYVARFAPADAVVLVRRCKVCGWREKEGQVWAADGTWSWPRS